MSNPLDDISNFVNGISDVVAITFREIGNFLKNVQLWFLTWFVFPLVILIFIGMLLLIFLAPIKIYPIIDANIQLFKKFIGSGKKIM